MKVKFTTEMLNRFVIGNTSNDGNGLADALEAFRDVHAALILTAEDNGINPVALIADLMGKVVYGRERAKENEHGEHCETDRENHKRN